MKSNSYIQELLFLSAFNRQIYFFYPVQPCVIYLLNNYNYSTIPSETVTELLHYKKKEANTFGQKKTGMIRKKEIFAFYYFVINSIRAKYFEIYFTTMCDILAHATLITDQRGISAGWGKGRCRAWLIRLNFFNINWVGKSLMI